MENSYRNSTPEAYRLDRVAQLFQDAAAFIDYNYNKPITIQDLAKHLNIDRTYCWKIFQQHIGQSPQQYLMHFRIEKAVEQMSHSSLSLGESAQSVGIPDVYYFSRLFKKIKGIPPSRNGSARPSSDFN